MNSEKMIIHFMNNENGAYFHQSFLAFQLDIIDTAVKGTLNVLASCVKHPTVKRVVFTSSMAAVLLSGKPLNAEVIVDETWFSDPEVCKEAKIIVNVLCHHMISNHTFFH